MSLNFRFAVISDLHIALTHTIWDHPSRFHLVEVSIPVLENILDRLSKLKLDFLLLPGDLTQHGEPANHTWLAERLAHLPYPTYVVPGNHDVPTLQANSQSIGLADFPHYYRSCGYDNPAQLYYTCQLLPGVRLIGLNSNQFDAQDKQLGCLDEAQLSWLQQVLVEHQDDLMLVMIHHNVVEHLPGQSRNPLGRRYMLDNAPTLLKMLREADVQLVFTGHLHVQDIACSEGVYDITTGSLVSYPHPYRVLELRTGDRGQRSLHITSERVEAVPGWETLQQTSRSFMSDRSQPFMLQLLMQSPLKLSQAEAVALAPSLRSFWADLADGDATFDFPEFPPAARHYFERFSAIDSNGQPQHIDNNATLWLHSRMFT